jgi:hypothetical protein
MEELRKQLRKVFFAILIPEAWKVGAGFAPASLMDSGYDCNAVGPLNYDYIAPSTAEEMGYCYEGRRYYLLAPNGPATKDGFPNPPGGSSGRPNNYFNAPQWIEKLEKNEEGQSDWGGITAQDFVAGLVETKPLTDGITDFHHRAVEGWKANSKENGGGFLDLTKASNYDFLLDGNAEEVNIRAPGFIQIPVCKPEAARAMWRWFDGLSASQKPTVFETLKYYPSLNEN